MELFEVTSNGKRTEIAKETLLSMYKTMVLIRTCENQLVECLLKKEIHCPVHLYTGQEAVAAGICANLEKTDYIYGNHRSHGHYLAKGGNLKKMIAEIFARKTGCSKGRGGSMHLIAKEVGLLGTVPIVAATIPIAVGSALATRLMGDNQKVTVTFFGDGATEEGTFHEAINLAAHRKLPVIFVCENNFYASHLHLLERRAKDSIVQIADAYGISSQKVDGNNVVDVYSTALDAINRARDGEGPSLLECRTFRWHGHVGPSMDIDVGVKRKESLTKWMKNDPIKNLRKILIQNKVSSDVLDLCVADTEKEVSEAIVFAKESPYPDPEDLLTYVFWSDDTKKEEPDA